MQKYKINNQGVLNTIKYIKEVTDVDVSNTIQFMISKQISDSTNFIIIDVPSKVKKLTGIVGITLNKEDVKELEPIDLTGWIPVDRADELPEDVPSFQACIIASDLEAIISSDFIGLSVGYVCRGKVYKITDTSGGDTNDIELTTGIFKLITL